jgi:branched-chain amino acid transport system substrate-binding protein
MRMRSFGSLLLGAVALVAVGAVACGGDDDDDGVTVGFSDAGYKAAGFTTITIEKGQPIKIGISAALAGDAKGLGVPIADSAEVAVKGVTIKGFEVQVVREDDNCTPEGGPAAADRLIKAKVVAVQGPMCSGGTRPSLALYEKAGITHISASATRGDLTQSVRPEGPYVTFFRVPVLNADQVREQAGFMKDTLKAKKVYVLNDTDDYGKDLAQLFQDSWKKGGGEIVGVQGFEKKQTDFGSIISSIKQAKPDAIYFGGFYAEATPFIQQLRADSATKGLPFMGTDGVKADDFIKGGKDAAEGAYVALPGDKGSEFDTYAKKYKDLFGGDGEAATFGAEAFDAMTAIIKAIEKVAVEDGGKLKIDMKKLNEAIKKSDFAGASGPVKFSENGDRKGAIVRIFQVKNGKYEQVK